jgi:hypothetical protein
MLKQRRILTSFRHKRKVVRYIRFCWGSVRARVYRSITGTHTHNYFFMFVNTLMRQYAYSLMTEMHEYIVQILSYNDDDVTYIRNTDRFIFFVFLFHPI